jgi:hypothetical protein
MKKLFKAMLDTTVLCAQGQARVTGGGVFKGRLTNWAAVVKSSGAKAD